MIYTETKVVNRKTRLLTFDFPPGDYDGVSINFPHVLKIKTFMKVVSHGAFRLASGEPGRFWVRCMLTHIPLKSEGFTNVCSFGPRTLRLKEGGHIDVEFIERATVNNRPSLWSSFRESTELGFVLFQPKDHKVSLASIKRAIRCSKFASG